ncbi:MAG: hypothetical protein ACE5GX_17625 [Thermoanaerobaculia bacterium]
MSSPHHPSLSAALSALLPGLGQLHNGERAKGAALACTAAAILCGLLWSTIGPLPSRSWLSALTLIVAYPFLWLPAVLDAHQRARGLENTFLSETRRWYVVFLLVVTGPMATPLLWQSPSFSRLEKIAWTAVVVLIALAAVFLILVVGPALESLLEGGTGLLGLSR